MSFTDPFVLTVNGVAVNLNRVSFGNMLSAYRSADGLSLFDISHKINRNSTASRVKTDVHYELRKPKEENPNDFHSLHLRTIVDRPEVASLGWTETELQHHLAAFSAVLGLAANVTKLYGLQT